MGSLSGDICASPPTPSTKFGIWVRAVRLPFLTATIVPVLLGAAVAWQSGVPFRPLEFALALAGMACIHFGLNLGNDYFDHTSGNDEANLAPTPFSGGSRVIQKRQLPAGAILRASIAFFLCGSAIGLVLNNFAPGNVVLCIGLIGVGIAYFYTAEPVRIGYMGGLGELACAIGFGPFVVIGAYYVQAHRLDITPLVASVPVGMLIGLVLFINEFPDFDADRQVKKRTLVVLLGKKRAAVVYVILLAAPYLAVVAAVMLRFAPVYALATWVTAPLALRAGKVALKQHDRVQELLPANKATIGIHFIFGILLSGAYVLDRLLR